MPEELLQTKAEVIGTIATLFQVLTYAGILTIVGCAIKLYMTIRHR